MKPTSPKMTFKSPFFPSSFFCSPLSFFDQNFDRKVPWNKTDNTHTLTGIPPHVNILTMPETIRKSQDGIADEVSRNIVAELRRRRKFGGFSEERLQSVLEGMWNKVEYALKDSQKM